MSRLKSAGLTARLTEGPPSQFALRMFGLSHSVLSEVRLGSERWEEGRRVPD